MKRLSKLFLIAALVLAVSIPVFAFAETTPGTRPLDGTGYMNGRGFDADAVTDAQGNPYALTNGYSVDKDGYCFFLDANGVSQPLYARMADGQLTALRSQNGALCWNWDEDNAAQTTTQTNTQTRGNFSMGGCRRWN